ncbi:MAG: OmpA family protein [Polyangiaceae bacterium]|nr:OmpA family protein [Polyangiaceae bacterium]
MRSRRGVVALSVGLLSSSILLSCSAGSSSSAVTESQPVRTPSASAPSPKPSASASASAEDPHPPDARRGCMAHGEHYEVGAKIPSMDDGCNTCFCSSSGHIACTLLNCEIQIQQPVRFEPGSSALDKDDRALLDEVARVLKDQARDYRLKLVGHSFKREAGGEKLSKARATAVRDYLVKAGIPEADIEVVGVGSTQPIGDDAANERRVEFKLEKR